MCVPYWWCTKHAQLIMGTWPIYKKHFLQLILTKKTFHLIKYLLATFIFSFLFNLYLLTMSLGSNIAETPVMNRCAILWQGKSDKNDIACRKSLHWRHNDHDDVWNQQPHCCLLNRLFGRTSKKHQSSPSLAFVQGIHRDRWIPRTKGQ